MSRFVMKVSYLEFASVNFSTRANEMKIAFAAGEVDISCFELDFDEFLQGTVNATISVAGAGDQDAAGVCDTLFAGLTAGNQDFDCRFESSTAGYKYTGKAFVTAFDPGGSRGDKFAYSATLRCTGTITRTSVV